MRCNVLEGAHAVASSARFFAGTRVAHPAIVDGRAGFVATEDGVPVAVLAFVIEDGRITAIDALGGDRARRRTRAGGVRRVSRAPLPCPPWHGSGRRHAAVRPPSTGNVPPVAKLARDEARKTTSSAISPGSATRLSGSVGA